MGKVLKGIRASATPYTPIVPAIPQAHADAEDPHAADALVIPSAAQRSRGADDADRAETQRLLHDARTEAVAIVNEARAQAGSIVAEAQMRAETVENDARKSGFDQGEKDGRAAVDDEMADMLASIRSVAEMARAERHRMMESAEPELVRLAVAIAERVLHAHIAVEPEAVTAIAHTALQHLIEREAVTIRVNPADLQTMRAHRDEMFASHDMSELRIVEDRRVDRGGVIIETASGSIDAKVATQMHEVRRTLHVEEPTEIPAADVMLQPEARVS